MKDRDRYFGDVVYEVWRSGGNPDAIDHDRVRDHQEDGLLPEESAASLVRRQRYAARLAQEDADDDANPAAAAPAKEGK